MRVALDIGQVRTGIARTDASGVLVFAHGVVLTENLASELQTLIREYEPVKFYIGMPVDLRGELGIAAHGIQALVETLFANIDIPFEMRDERMTTKIAESRLRSLEHSSRQMRPTIDAMAAVVLLEEAVERERRSPDHE